MHTTVQVTHNRCINIKYFIIYTNKSTLCPRKNYNTRQRKIKMSNLNAS